MSGLVWEDNDYTADGRFAIQTERVRGEGTYYELWIYDEACAEMAKRLDIDRGSYGDKRRPKRLAQRLVDLVERDAAGPRLTPPQARVLDFLYRAGWASEKQTARMLYGQPRQKARAAAVIGHLADAGLAETHLVHGGPHRAWKLTEAGSALAHRRADRQKGGRA